MHRAIKLLIPMLAVALCYGASSDLTDAQINAAIERAARRNGDKVFSSIVKQYVRIGNWHVLYVLSPSWLRIEQNSKEDRLPCRTQGLWDLAWSPFVWSQPSFR